MALYSFHHQEEIAFSDTDMAGIVHFSNFLRLVEKAEHHLYRSLEARAFGIEDGQPYGWPKVNIQCNYLKPLRFEDQVTIQLDIVEIGNKTIDYQFKILLSDTTCAEGTMTVICTTINETTGQIKARDIPKEFKDKLDSVANKP